MKKTTTTTRQLQMSVQYIELSAPEGVAQWSIGLMRGDKTIPRELTGCLNGQLIYFGAFGRYDKAAQEAVSARAVQMGLRVCYLGA